MPNNIISNISHVIFDVDGLLLDSESIYTDMGNDIAARYNKKFTLELKTKLMGKTREEAAKIFIQECDLPITEREFFKLMFELMQIYFPKTPLMPGADKIIKHLSEHNIPMAIATSSDRESFLIKSSSHSELFSRFHHVVTGSDDVENIKGKPNPDLFIASNRKFLPVPPSTDKVLVFEDSINGVKAGLSAGMKVVWVQDLRFFSESSLEQATGLGTHQILTSLEQFKPEEFGLPAYV